MTNQYEQPSINQQQIQIVSLDTTSLDPVDTVLTALQVDGTGIALQFFGGGFDPSNAIADGYTVRGTTTWARDAGVIAGAIGAPIVAGGAGAPSIVVVNIGNNVVLRVTPGIASLYLHRINVRKRPIG